MRTFDEVLGELDRLTAASAALALTDASQARDRLRRAITAFRVHEGALAQHLAYGPCSKADYEALHAMHVSDHFSKLSRSPS